MKKILPRIFILTGVVLITIAVVLWWIDSHITSQSESYHLSSNDWIAIIVGIIGLGSGIKGWIDLFKKETPIPPSNRVDIQDINGQIAAGENARNIQAQTYIEKQIIQQTRELEKAVDNRKRGFVEFSTSEGSGVNVTYASRVRFLDALDSARFSERTAYENARLLNVLYAKAQLFLALAFGDNIVVSENQFFDSQGFLETFDELYHAAKKLNVDIDLPIRVAIQKENKDMFHVIEKNLSDEKYVLSLWKHLNSDRDRRELWANHIGRKQRPPEGSILDEEKALLTKLWTALEYFTPERYVIAKTIAPEFIGRIKRVITLSDEDINDLHTGIRRGIPHQRKYFEHKEEADAAKELRDVLRKIQDKVGEINTRSLIRRELTDYEEEIKEGVIALTDVIYNQTIGIGTTATLIQSSTFPPRIHKYIRAGYSLSTYLQDTSYSLQSYTDWEIYSFDYFENLEGLDDPSIKGEFVAILDAAQQNAPWEKLIEMQRKASWHASLKKFRESLTRLQSVEENLSGSLKKSMRSSLENERNRLESQLKKYWAQHAKNISKLVVNSFWILTETEIVFSHPRYRFSIHLTYSFLKTKLDMEQDKDYKIWRNKHSFKGRFDERIDAAR